MSEMRNGRATHASAFFGKNNGRSIVVTTANGNDVPSHAPLPQATPHVETVSILSLSPSREIASIGEHDPLDCLAKLNRGNAEHVRRVVEWLVGSTTCVA